MRPARHETAIKAAAHFIAILAISGTAIFRMGQRLMLPLSMQPQINAKPRKTQRYMKVSNCLRKRRSQSQMGGSCGVNKIRVTTNRMVFRALDSSWIANGKTVIRLRILLRQTINGRFEDAATQR
jgi:hypothetical protein